MMRSVLIGSLLVFALGVPALADEIGHARQHPIDLSGIQGHVFFVDTENPAPNNGLIVMGTATGLDPTKAYLSLLYDNGSIPGGPNACEASQPDPLTGAQMVVGVWSVNPDGTGSLFVRKTGASYVALSQVRTISIRQIGVPDNLRACGEIARNPVH